MEYLIAHSSHCYYIEYGEYGIFYPLVYAF